MDGTSFMPAPVAIPMNRSPLPMHRAPKLAFMRGLHPAYQAENDPGNSDRLARGNPDNTIFAGAYSGFVQYPREISADNRPSAMAMSTDSVTRWTPETGTFGVHPLSSRPANANFFASDPQQFGSVGGGFCKGMDGGGVDLVLGGTPSGQFSFLTPGTDILRPVYRQAMYGPINPTMSTKDLQASSVYNPIPAFSTLVPKLP